MIEAIPAGSTLEERYIITQCIGAGAHARVYAGVDTQSSKAVALKVTHRRDPELLARFRREARICARLGAEAAGIVRCYACHELPGGGAYLVLDLIEDAQRLDLDAGPLEGRLDQLERLARAVAWLHERDVIHRDLKPSNVLTTPRGRIYLTDFGLAKELGGSDEEASDADLTLRNASLGTPAYMPLEQFEDARGVDQRADVFALGAMLFRALTGLTPYRGDAVEVLSAQMQVRHTDAAAPRPSNFDPSVPPALNALCLAATELDPELRLPNAGAFLEGLRKARRGEAPSETARRRRPSSGKITLDKLEVVVNGEPSELPILREFGAAEEGLRRFDVVFERSMVRVVLLGSSATRTDDRRLAQETELVAQLSGEFTWRRGADVEGGLMLERPIDLPETDTAPWPPALVVDLGLDLLGGLVELHELGFAHCALEPSACGLRGGSWSSLRELRAAVSRGETRLVLGGFAEARSKSFLRRSAAGHSEGLPPPRRLESEYAAPEAELSEASDLYAAGRILSVALGPRADTLPEPFGERLRELLAELSHSDPEHRPGAEEARAILANLAQAEAIGDHLLRQRAL